MKVLHLSTSDLDGGAARAAYRLHQGLRTIGVDSQMLVRAKSSICKTVIAERSVFTKIGPSTAQLPMRFYPKRDHALFSTQWFPDAVAAKVAQMNPDFVHLHWICNGFLRPETLARFGKPIVWTLHDMWPFTGGCHYSGDCDRYTKSCGQCPLLHSQRQQDLSHWVWKRKARAWKNLNLTIVSPSQWLADCARSSLLFSHLQVEVIPHGLNLDKFEPIEQATARSLLNLPQDKQIILFGASPGTTNDPRKGFQLVQPALHYLSQKYQGQIELVIFGHSQSDQNNETGFQTHYLGQFYDDISLALVYSAATVMVVPSLQEAFGQTASEALACGTPVVGFNATGLKDIVHHQINGYLAKPFEFEDLAQGITWVLEYDNQKALRQFARSTAIQNFSLELQAQRHLSLYQTLRTG